MSLKGFHIVFIIFSILITFFFAYWAMSRYGMNNNSGYLVTGIVSTVLGFLLIAYGVRVAKKLQV